MTKPVNYFIFLSSMIAFCNRSNQTTKNCTSAPYVTHHYKTIDEIPTPTGYERAPIGKNSFGAWLRKVKLKEDSRVYLYNGRLRDDQLSQFAVLGMPVGNKDLQQCADAVMRLRAEYFFGSNRFDSIRYKSTDGIVLSFARWLNGERYRLIGNKLRSYASLKSADDNRTQLERFLEVVFSYCGTISLNKETRPIADIDDITNGDVLVKPGSPGHAMIVADVAVNEQGDKIFMLAQGYMPAQNIHIVKNLKDTEISPWYRIEADAKIVTPQWIFYKSQLKRWSASASN